MGEEFARWLDAAKPGLPYAVVVFVAIVATVVVTVLLLRKNAVAAQRDRKRVEHLWHNIECVTEPTVAIDMRPVMANAKHALIDPRKILTHLRERRSVGDEFVPPADWTDDEPAQVKRMTDRDGWPNTTYQPRGWLPRLRRKPVPVVAVTPKELGERITRIREEKKQMEASK